MKNSSSNMISDNNNSMYHSAFKMSTPPPPPPPPLPNNLTLNTNNNNFSQLFQQDPTNQLLANQLKLQLDQCKRLMSTNNYAQTNHAANSFKIDDILNLTHNNQIPKQSESTKLEEQKFSNSTSSFSNSSRPSSSSSLSSSPLSYTAVQHQQNPNPNFNIEALMSHHNFSLALAANPFLNGQYNPYQASAPPP